MQERSYESGSCVQIICAILGVHPNKLGTTWAKAHCENEPLLRNIAMKDLSSSATQDFCPACTNPQGEWFLRREPSSNAPTRNFRTPPLIPLQSFGMRIVGPGVR